MSTEKTKAQDNREIAVTMGVAVLFLILGLSMGLAAGIPYSKAESVAKSDVINCLKFSLIQVAEDKNQVVSEEQIMSKFEICDEYLL